MKLHRRSAGPSSDPVAAGRDKASRAFPVRSIYDEEDQRPRREDLAYGRTPFFDIPVPLPRFLRSKKTRKDPQDRLS